MPIGKVTDVQRVNTQHVTDEQHNKDIKYKDRLTIQILNGKFEGAKSTITNDYVKSQADSERFSKTIKFYYISLKNRMMLILLKKRDSLVVLITGVFLITILLVGRQVGLQSILSLILNSIAVLGAIYIHNQIGSTSLFLLMVIAMIVSTTLTLLLVIGWRMRTLITIISTLAGTFLCIGIAELVIRMTHGNGIKYETMSFLTLPPKDVFLASVLIGSLGAVMDVAITIASGMNEIPNAHHKLV